ncbi:MAG: hypothetical protein WB699_05595 [Bacteroidota bacterium]
MNGISMRLKIKIRRVISGGANQSLLLVRAAFDGLLSAVGPRNDSAAFSQRRARRLNVVCALTGAAILALMSGCDHKLDLGTLPRAVDVTVDTSYVLIDPPITGFSGPEDIIVGNDELLYVADTKANRLVMLNRAGQFMSARTLLHPRSVSQDSRLDLLVGGEIVSTSGDTVGAIFRIHLVSATPDSAHRLDMAPVDTVWRESAHPNRRFPGIAVLSDNTYLAVRNGPDNSSFIDPDSRVLIFNSHDHFVAPVSGLVSGTGTGISNINQITGITAFPNTFDFVLTQSAQGTAYGALWMTYSSTVDFVGWLPKFDPANPLDRSSDFVRPYRYLDPEGVAIDRSRRDIFVADADLDSVIKFNSRGVFKSESFGRTLTNGRMVRPTGIAFYDTYLYVLDGDLGIVYRFRLSTDIPR